jgi:biopolymer transport protein TolQ
LDQCNITPQGFSLWGMFLQADFVVKAVIILLIIASIWSWGVIFNKVVTLRKLDKNRDAILRKLRSQESLELPEQNVQQFDDPFNKLFSLITKEWKNIKERPLTPEKKEFWLQRIEHSMQVLIEIEREKLQKNMGLLASTGSTAPFIGLFGTVWGIMHSFQCMATSKNTSLSVIAPGISEALFATAIGLIVAIPAVIAYNRLTIEINSNISKLENFAQELTILCLNKLES